MRHLTNLFKVLECTRAMPQTGYALSGIPQNEQSNLAEHHYLVAIIAWQLAKNANAKGATLNVEKVLEYALVHDLGELFGGDIALPYWKVNPKARELAKAFENENRRFLATRFGSQQSAVTQVMAEESARENDEALLASIADYVECVQYKFFIRRLSVKDMPFVLDDLRARAEKMGDTVARDAVLEFLGSWEAELPKGETIDALSDR